MLDREIFVQNIKIFSAAKGLKPTVACREAGVGTSFINDINRGQTPSVEKVQLLAQYLGVTISELLGEEKTPIPKDGDGLSEKDKRLATWFQSLPPEMRKAILTLGGGPVDLAE